MGKGLFQGRKRRCSGDSSDDHERSSSSMTTTTKKLKIVVGIDGCRKGWVAIALKGGILHSASEFSAFKDVLNEYKKAQVLAVDIPLGLAQGSYRNVDSEAKKKLRKRSYCIFPTPPLEILLIEDYKDANAFSKDLTGKGISRQSYALRKKILELRNFYNDNRIVEVHPELSFAKMNMGEPLIYTKKSWNGFMERLQLLGKHGIQIPQSLRVESSSPDDVLDAAAAAWSAYQLCKGKADKITGKPSQKDGDREIEIWR